MTGSDPDSDLAVLELEDGDWSLQPLPLGDSNEVRVGQLSVAMGAPFGQEFTMTSGIVSAIGRNIRGEGEFTIPEVIQTDAAINPGNSGGPAAGPAGPGHRHQHPDTQQHGQFFRRRHGGAGQYRQAGDSAPDRRRGV